MLMTSVAAMMLASCSQDELKEVSKGRAIDFQALTASRATETNGTNLKTFYASAFTEEGTAFEDFAKVAFTLDGGFYESVKKYYWPSTGTLYFSAFAPESTAFTGDVTLTKGGFAVSNYTPAYKLADQVDLVYATGEGTSANETSGVQLNFKHALAQIEIKAKNENNLIYKVTGVKISSVATSGSFSNATDWTEGDVKDTYKVLYDTPVVLGADAQSLMGETGNAMLVPQELIAWNPSDKENENQGTFLALKVNITDKDGNLRYPRMQDKTNTTAYGWVAVPIDTKWEAGMKYVFTLDFSTGSGAVAPAVPNAGDTNNGEDPSDDEKNPSGDEENAPEPGQPSLGSPIHFTVTVTPWTEVTDTPSNPNVSL